MSAPAVRMPEEIRAELDRTFSSVPPAAPVLDLGDRSWDCLAGEAPAVCSHVRVTRSTENGLTDVVCECGHAWLTVEA